MSEIAVTGDPRDVALAGVEPNGDPDRARLVATLRDPGAPDAIRLGPPGDRDRLIGPAGDGLWRLSPWPVSDSLFDLEPAERPHRALVVSGKAKFQSECSELLAGRDWEAENSERLTLEGLRDATVVVMHAEQPNLPAEAMAVLASGRTLVTGPCELRFGLESGIEFLRAESGEEAGVFASIVLGQPDAFDPMRVLGRLAAERHRASTFYGRLLADLELEGVL